MTLYFAFYGRVSTEERQDPAASEQWQLDLGTRLIAPPPHDGVVVERFFDVNVSRSVPWRRRPAASRLLARLKDSTRTWNEVVIGEPARAFEGSQHDDVIPTMGHYGVRLWSPTLNGPFDPTNHSHMLLMGFSGVNAKVERAVIQKRVGDSMRSLAATSDRHMGGRPPYGYVLADAGPHPNPSRRADGKCLHRLELDPVTAPVVTLIFTMFVDGHSLRSIAQFLVTNDHPSPSAHDPARNPHRAGVGWAISAIRAILHNERYTGIQVYGKQPRKYRLLDPDQPTLGHVRGQEWAGRDQWVLSNQQFHAALVSREQFDLAQARMTTRRTPEQPRPKISQGRYAFAGRIRCGLCGRRMEGSTTRDYRRYRCRLRQDYAARASDEHPSNLQVGEAPLVAAVDAWIASAFNPDNLGATIASLVQAAGDDDLTDRVVACRKEVAAQDAALARYRVLALTGDLKVVAEWIAEAEAARRLAQAELANLTRAMAAEPASVQAMLDAVGDVATAIRDAPPEDRRALYEALDLQATYDAQRNTVEVVCQIGAPGRGNCSCPRGDTIDTYMDFERGTDAALSSRPSLVPRWRRSRPPGGAGPSPPQVLPAEAATVPRVRLVVSTSGHGRRPQPRAPRRVLAPDRQDAGDGGRVAGHRAVLRSRRDLGLPPLRPAPGRTLVGRERAGRTARQAELGDDHGGGEPLRRGLHAGGHHRRVRRIRSGGDDRGRDGVRGDDRRLHRRD